MRNPVPTVLLFLCARASAGVAELPASLEATVGAGGFDELCVRLGAGESARYAFDAAAPMDFNVHWHRGDEVLYPVKRDAVARLEGRFRADRAETYCLMWTNRGGSGVPLRAHVERVR